MNKTPTLQQKCAQVLKELAPDVTSTDKNEAVQKFSKSYPTIQRYLRGEIKDIDVAITLIGFFKEKVNQRKVKFKKLAA